MNQSLEQPRESLFPGIPMLLLGLAMLPAAIFVIVLGANDGRDPNPPIVIAGILMIPAAILTLRGLVLVNPNQSKVVLLFGRYVGTIRKHGFFWINPFTVRRPVSLRMHNFVSETLKVNDLRGVAHTPHDEDYESYVSVQTESALRHLASLHPYDESEDESEEITLRGSSDDVNAELQRELTDRLSLAGIDVSEARLAHLAYAPEIASAMLQRQQAAAIIAARTKIVDGAVGMVEMALDHLKERDVVDFDEERKAAMVSNLLVVLCSERGASPVVNTGSIYQ